MITDCRQRELYEANVDKIITQIEKIREINTQNKLVIFVGAGVSKNSGICSWWELVKDIATKIGYNDICEKCEMKYEYHSECGDGFEFCSSNSKCFWKYNFSADEFLKIPQYFIDTMGENEYYNFIKKKFCQSFVPNEIDELIIQLNPEHIITTNYDHLLEDVRHPNVGNYTVIKSDKDLLEQNGRRYIIKMHGDIDEIEQIVLKEDDYLKYSQKHILIETYIKSLLIDKTFLFIGYSLNDNNLSLIMSYIDYFVKEKEVEKRSPHYLVVNSVSNPERQARYWANKGVELIDLSQLNADMKKRTKCNSIKSEHGQSLFTFLKYLYDNKLPYSNDKKLALEKSLLNISKQFDAFSFVSYTDLIKACQFLDPVKVINSTLYFTNENEYKLLKSIFQEQKYTSKIIKKSFTKAGLSGIRCNKDSFDIENYCYVKDSLFEMSLKNQYKEILDIVNKNNNELQKAYYYFLVYRTSDELTKIMDGIKKQVKGFDYHSLSIKKKLFLAVFEYNSIALRLLNYNNDNKELWKKLIDFLNSASYQSTSFETIKKMIGTNDETLITLNNYLIKHEVYYMKKSTTIKLGGSIYGELFDLQNIVYDYYKFYKKNYLMLDWFNNVEKICEPYIKAILCTYYPDEYQFSNNRMGRTKVTTYPINIVDIDMIVKHTTFKNFNSWLIHYKVSKIKIFDGVDISEIFQNFCISMRNYWNIYLDEQLKVFSKLISLIELTEEQRQHILASFITLVKPDKSISIRMLRNCLNAIWIYVQEHYDNKDSNYEILLSLMINEQLIRDIFDGGMEFEKLIEKISVHADKAIYNDCSKMIINNKNNHEKCYWAFIFRNILLKYDNDYWKKWIKSNISENSVSEIFIYIKNEIIAFDNEIKIYFNNKMVKYKNSKVNTYTDNQKEVIDTLLILLLIGRISALEDIEFLRQYTEYSDHLDFLFNPDTFDYSKITSADYMWCNFINNENYREIILQHKTEFWSKDDEKRIRLGFGNDFENRTAYKYLFD